MSRWVVWPVMLAALLFGGGGAWAANCPRIPGPPVSGARLTYYAGAVAERRLSGLATFFNGVDYYGWRDGAWRSIGAIDEVESVCLIAAVGRFRSLVIDTAAAGSDATARGPAGLVRFTRPLPARLIAADHLTGPILGPLRYPHLWRGLRPLADAGEWLLVRLNALGLSWGAAIVVFACLIRLLLWPASRLTARAQAAVERQDKLLQPVLVAIKRDYRGEEAHHRIVAAHRELGIPSIYRVKPIVGALAQVPLLIAIFSLLGTMPQLRGIGFFWIVDLSIPDSIGHLPAALPLLGREISLLPVIMAAATVVAGLVAVEPSAALARRRRAYVWLTGLAVLVFLYPFPAALILYWTTANLLQGVQGVIARSRRDD